MKTLHLTLKKEYFDQILSGEKTEEFREYKKYWWKRLKPQKYSSDFKKFDQIVFKNGYAKNAPTITVEFKGTKLEKNIQTPLGKGTFFVIKLGKIKETL